MVGNIVKSLVLAVNYTLAVVFAGIAAAFVHADFIAKVGGDKANFSALPKLLASAITVGGWNRPALAALGVAVVLFFCALMLPKPSTIIKKR